MGKGLWAVYLGMRSSPQWKDRCGATALEGEGRRAWWLRLQGRGAVQEVGPAAGRGAGSGRRVPASALAEAPGAQQAGEGQQGRVDAAQAGAGSWEVPAGEQRRAGQARTAAPPSHPGTATTATTRVQGLKWVLDMYREGRCSDFRSVYDAQSPTAPEIIDFLASGRAARGGQPTQRTQVATRCLTSSVRSSVRERAARCGAGPCAGGVRPGPAAACDWQSPCAARAAPAHGRRLPHRRALHPLPGVRGAPAGWQSLQARTDPGEPALTLLHASCSAAVLWPGRDTLAAGAQ